ncbi:MAG: hypothetical protein ACRDRO_24910 [Pseudonocardiaceae bacterium]
MRTVGASLGPREPRDHRVRRLIEGQELVQTRDAERAAQVVVPGSRNVYLRPAGGGRLMQRDENRQTARVQDSRRLRLATNSPRPMRQPFRGCTAPGRLPRPGAADHLRDSNPGSGSLALAFHPRQDICEPPTLATHV